MAENKAQEMEFIKGMVSKSAACFSEEEMRRIQDATVAQAGFGGIGAFVLELLARWGIKRFRLLDMDKFELSNMNRQVFATPATMGKPKAEVAAQRIREINPYAIIEMIRCERLTRDNVEDFIKGSTVIINGVDFPSGQIPLHYHAKRLKIPVVNPHCMQVKEATIEVFDYRDPAQQSIDAPTKSAFLNNIMHKHFRLFEFNEQTLSADSLAAADKRFMGRRGATLNFVTNLAACLTVGETIKLLSGKGKQVVYPKQIYVDPYNLRFGVRSVYGWQRAMGYVKERIIKK